MTITINGTNDAPVASDGSLTTNEDNSKTGTLIASDVDVETLTYSIVANGSKGTATITNINTGAYTYTPNADAVGADTFTFKVNDGTVDSNTATISVTINAFNDMPVFTKGANQTVNEDAGLQTVAGWATGIDDSDPEVAQTLTFNVSNDNNPLFAVQPAIASNGTLTYTPTDDANGSATVTVTLTDDATAGGGALTTAAQTFTITVSAVVDIADDTDTTNEDTAKIIAVLANDTFSVTAVVSSVTQGANGTVTTDGTNVTYTPNADWHGSDSFTYTVTSGGVTETANVSVTVNAVADVVNDALTTNEDTAGSVDVLATDSFSGTAVVSAVTQGANGTVTTDFTNVTYTPNADWNGADSFTYTVDNNGADETATVNVTVNVVNDVPSFTAGADQAILETAGAQTVAGWATGLYKGPADEAGQTLTFNVTNDNNGLFSVQPAIDATGTLTYTPANITASGTATVTVTLSDDGGTAFGGVDTSASQLFFITVTAVYTIDASAGAHGSISPSGAVLVVDTQDQAFTITPDTATDYYVITDILVDGSSVLSPKPLSGSTTYSFTNVVTDHIITASFDDHGTGVCYDPTPADDIFDWAKDAGANDTATILQFPEGNPTPPPFVVNGEINPVGNTDWFKIIVPSGGGILSIYTDTDTDTHGTLLDSNCNVIASHDDINGTKDPDFEIVRNVNAGTYYLAVREGFNTSTITYQLHVELEPDDYADTCDTNAHLLTCDTSTVSNAEIKPAGDRDFFKLVITESKLVTVYTTSSGQMDTYGTIHNDNCDEIAHNNDAAANDKDFRIEWQLKGPVAPATDKTYYIGVKHYSATETGTYDLHVECALAYAIEATVDFGGTITPGGIVIVGAGSSQQFTIKANLNNTIRDVFIDGVSVNDLSGVTDYDASKYTFSALDENVDTEYIFTFNDIDTNHTIQGAINRPPEACVDLSDTPLDARKHAAPPNIMVLLDDSQSMDWEIMTLEGGSTGVSSGQLTIGNKAYHYLYNMDDRVNKTGQGSNVLIDADERLYWLSQWQGHNKVYYKSGVTYEPWPTKLDVNPNTPPSRPDEPDVIANMSDVYVSYGDTSSIIIIDNASYKSNDPVSFAKTNANGGAWLAATNSVAYGADDVYYWTSSSGDYTATWTPKSIPAGEYEVFARWVANDGRSDSVPYTITYASGVSTTVLVNQTKNGGAWVPLGTYDFDAGAGNVTVTLTNHTVTDNGDGTYSNTVSIDAVKFLPTTLDSVAIPIAHYYTCDGDAQIVWDEDNQGVPFTTGVRCTGDRWLVIVDGGSIKYFKFIDLNDDNFVDSDPSELTEVAEGSVPAAVRTDRTYDQERQNFANWFTYYRKRDLLTRAAVSRVVTTLQGVMVGIRGLEGTVSIPVKPINVAGADETSTLLAGLYEYPLETRGAATSSSPVRTAFQDVGQYFDLTDDPEDGGIGPSPIASQEEGGGCQQNFVIIFSDAYYNGLSTGSLTPNDDTPGDYSGYAPYNDGVTNTLADIAMNYYMRDLAPEVPDEVPINPFDSARHQHLVTYTVTFGVIGTLNPDLYDLDLCEDTYRGNFGFIAEAGVAGSPPCPPWPSPVNSDTKKIDDLFHAAVNGRGEFHSANDVNELIQAFKSVLDNIEARIGSAASVSVNGDELFGLLGEDVRMYQSSYSTDGWTGDVKAYSLNVDTGEVVRDVPLFSAAEKLKEKTWSSRIIVTYDGTQGIPFQAADLTDAQKALLYKDWVDWDTSGVTVTNIVNYLRGDDGNEENNGGSFRNRVHKLGDIVHSSPEFSNNVLYTGGNDGMLHAFSAQTGEEFFAYVPKLVFENLHLLADPNYSHIYFVDLTPVVKRVEYVDTLDEDGDFDIADTIVKNILVGGLAKGGKGYYALDISGVTEAASVASESDLAGRVMWEYPRSGVTESEIADLGYTYSRPAIVKSHDPNHPWLMIFGNGYNSVNSHAVLYIMNPLNGTLIKKLDTGVVTAGVQCNGLSTPLAADVDDDDVVDYVYAGDLKGNMWKFDLTSNDYNNWEVAFKSGTTPQPLFQAKDDDGDPQPITGKPDVMFHCEQNGYMVVFGTGRYLGETDFLYNDTQTIYGVWDYGDDTDDDEYLGSFERGDTYELSNQQPTNGKITLLEQTELSVTQTTTGGQKLRVLTNNPPIWATVTDADAGEEDDISQEDFTTDGLDNDGDTLFDEADEKLGHAGWYYDVPAGERFPSDLFIREGRVVSISFFPSQTPCGTGGNSVVLEMDACSGGRLELPQFDINDDGVIDENDLITVTIDGVEVLVAPTGIEYEGRLQPPAILRQQDEEIKYFSTNVGSIVTLKEVAVSLGIIYWKEVE